MSKLNTYLLINSMFSMLSAIVMFFLSNQLERIFDIANPYIFPLIALNLFIFALFVFGVYMRTQPKRMMVKVIVALDWLWVVASALILMFDPFDISREGMISIAVVALWIAFLAVKQKRYNL